jgi:hypothetical protein
VQKKKRGKWKRKTKRKRKPPRRVKHRLEMPRIVQGTAAHNRSLHVSDGKDSALSKEPGSTFILTRCNSDESL